MNTYEISFKVEGTCKIEARDEHEAEDLAFESLFNLQEIDLIGLQIDSVAVTNLEEK